VAERSEDPAEGESVVLVDLLGPGRIKARVTLRIAPLPAPPPTAGVAADTPTESARPGDTMAEAPNGEPSRGEAPSPAAPSPAAPTGPPDEGAPRAAPAPAPPPDVAIAETLSNRLPLYYPLAEQTVMIGGVTATRVDSAFAFTPRATLPHRADIPVVLRAIDLVLLRGQDALSIQVAAPIEDFEAQRPTLEAIIASVRIDPSAAPSPEPPPRAPVAELPDAGASNPTATSPGAGEVQVAGQVVDAESGLPVPGAIVVFLAPGNSVDDLNDDNLTQIAYTTGLADSSGRFATNRPLGRPGHYGVMLVADGYRWIGTDDGVSTEGETPAHLDVGAVRLRRR
jgi:hypothetical protein